VGHCGFTTGSGEAPENLAHDLGETLVVAAAQHTDMYGHHVVYVEVDMIPRPQVIPLADGDAHNGQFLFVDVADSPLGVPHARKPMGASLRAKSEAGRVAEHVNVPTRGDKRDTVPSMEKLQPPVQVYLEL
jgi:hypothetical protein